MIYNEEMDKHRFVSTVIGLLAHFGLRIPFYIGLRMFILCVYFYGAIVQGSLILQLGCFVIIKEILIVISLSISLLSAVSNSGEKDIAWITDWLFGPDATKQKPHISSSCLHHTSETDQSCEPAVSTACGPPPVISLVEDPDCIMPLITCSSYPHGISRVHSLLELSGCVLLLFASFTMTLEGLEHLITHTYFQEHTAESLGSDRFTHHRHVHSDTEESWDKIVASVLLVHALQALVLPVYELSQKEIMNYSRRNHFSVTGMFQVMFYPLVSLLVLLIKKAFFPHIIDLLGCIVMTWVVKGQVLPQINFHVALLINSSPLHHSMTDEIIQKSIYSAPWIPISVTVTETLIETALVRTKSVIGVERVIKCVPWVHVPGDICIHLYLQLSEVGNCGGDHESSLDQTERVSKETRDIWRDICGVKYIIVDCCDSNAAEDSDHEIA